MTTFDLIMILLFVVIISIIIGLNIVCVVDKKLGNIEIKMPKPTVVVNLDKDGNVENFNNISGEPRKADTLEMRTTTPITTIRLQDTKDSTPTRIENPDQLDVVNYGNYVCYKKGNIPDSPKFTEAEVAPIKCLNESANYNFKTGDEQLNPFPVGCQKSQHDVSQEDYFKNKYYPPVANLDDKYLKGYNIVDYNDYAGIREVGRIVLNQPQKFPQPNNSIQQHY